MDLGRDRASTFLVDGAIRSEAAEFGSAGCQSRVSPLARYGL
jgi:hypothetical protein